MSVIKRLSLYGFTLLGRDLVSVVRIRESPYYRVFFFFKENIKDFFGTLETVRNTEVSVPRGFTVISVQHTSSSSHEQRRFRTDYTFHRTVPNKAVHA